MADQDWPSSLTFARDDTRVSFASGKDFASWLARERDAWASLVQIGMRQAVMNQNQTILDQLGSGPSKQQLTDAQQIYWPSTGILGRVATRIVTPQIRMLFLTEIMQPGSLNNNGQQDSIVAKTLAYSYIAMGKNLIVAEETAGLIPTITQSIEHVDQLRESDAQWTETFKNLVQRCDDDWNKKIDGYEAKVALSAPKTYWTARAQKHKDAGDVARRNWFWAMVFFVAAVIIGFVLNFTFPPEQNLASIIIQDAQRFIVFGTLLGIAVWWLRQKLRDVRMHEHLAEDADERATMVETYAALRGTGLQDANLDPIFAALYRPAMTVLADDNGPVLPVETLIRAAADLAKSK